MSEISNEPFIISKQSSILKVVKFFTEGYEGEDQQIGSYIRFDSQTHYDHMVYIESDPQNPCDSCLRDLRTEEVSDYFTLPENLSYLNYVVIKFLDSISETSTSFLFKKRHCSVSFQSIFTSTLDLDGVSPSKLSKIPFSDGFTTSEVSRQILGVHILNQHSIFDKGDLS